MHSPQNIKYSIRGGRLHPKQGEKFVIDLFGRDFSNLELRIEKRQELENQRLKSIKNRVRPYYSEPPAGVHVGIGGEVGV